VVVRLHAAGNKMKENRAKTAERINEMKKKDFTHKPQISKTSRRLASNQPSLLGEGGRLNAVIEQREKRRQELEESVNTIQKTEEPLWQSKRYANVPGHKTFEDFDEWRTKVDEKVQSQRENQAKASTLSGGGSTRNPGTPKINKHSSQLMSTRLPASEVYTSLYEEAGERRKRQDEAREEAARQKEKEMMAAEEEGAETAKLMTEPLKGNKVYADCVSNRLHNNGVMRAISTREDVTAYETSCGRNTNFNTKRGTQGDGQWAAVSMRSWERSLY